MPNTTPPLSDAVFLAQTDTTVGFLSQNGGRLEQIKSRLPGKQFLKVFADLKTYKASGGRVPNRHKAVVRRAEKTTFIVKGQAFRIVAAGEHHDFLKRYGWMYSTSANQSGHAFERTFCESNADIIVEDSRGLCECEASRILRLGNATRSRIR
jgi:tRNA A37 threonylcarbamoyladenosine synthetase subunit TsaC/SUA5/YrdC